LRFRRPVSDVAGHRARLARHSLLSGELHSDPRPEALGKVAELRELDYAVLPAARTTPVSEYPGRSDFSTGQCSVIEVRSRRQLAWV